jgi:hypothetical protein
MHVWMNTARRQAGVLHLQSSITCPTPQHDVTESNQTDFCQGLKCYQMLNRNLADLIKRLNILSLAHPHFDLRRLSGPNT